MTEPEDAWNTVQIADRFVRSGQNLHVQIREWEEEETDTMKIAVIYENGRMVISENEIQAIKKACPEAEVRFSMNGRDLIEEGFMADAVVCWGAGAAGAGFTARDYCAFDTSLKWVHSLSAGIEALLTDPVIAEQPAIRISTSSGIHGIPMANHVMGFILYFLRLFPEMEACKAAHSWERPMPDEATDKVLTIIGMGHIGSEIARVAKCFGMHVIGVKRSTNPVPNVDELVSTEEVEKALAVSDFVVMLLPANARTKHYMSADRFAAMKEGSVFINVGRGMTVDEKALIEAVTSGHLRGAAIDAFEDEPLPADSPMWDLPRSIFTCHVAADTPRYMERAIAVFAENIPLYLAGEKLTTEVDRARY